MRSRSFVALVCALCTAGAFSCSDDGAGTPGGGGTSQLPRPLNPTGGSGGVSNGGSANNGGSGGSSGSSQGGSASNVGGAGNGGAAGDGLAGSSMTAAGSGGDEPDAGGADDEPDAGGGEPPDDETVGFSDVFPILRTNCGGCHGNPNGGLPPFAQVNEAAAYAITQNTGAQGLDISQRIVVRAVDLRTMPPSCGGGNLGTGTCLDANEAAALEDWVDDGALP